MMECIAQGKVVLASIIALQMNCTENFEHRLPEMKLHGLVPNSTLSVSDLYIPTAHDRSANAIQQNRWTDLRNT
jgi:hypothetical protein